MKKQSTKGPAKKQPGKPKKKITQAQRADRIFNPNLQQGSLAIQHQKASTSAAARKVMNVYGTKKKSEKKKKSKLLAWAELVSNPFVGCNFVKCPLNFNPAPSLLSFRCLLNNTLAQFKVSGTFCRQLSFWPGHGPLAQPPVLVGTTGAYTPADEDEVSFHSRLQSISGTFYCPGPLNSYGGTNGPYTASAAHLSVDSTVAIGGIATTTAGGSSLGWDNPLPLTADPRVAGHMRWKMIAMGVRIRNITAVGNRGGTIVSVQPANVVDLSTFNGNAQISMDRDPSFQIWGDGTDEVEISWIPRTRDLSYWHSTAASTAAGVDFASTALVGPGLVVFCNATSIADQYFSMEQWAHFEISGTNAQVFSQQTHSLATPVAPVQQALGSHIQNSPTAHGIDQTIAAAVGEGVSAVSKMASEGFHEAAKMGFKAAIDGVRASV